MHHARGAKLEAEARRRLTVATAAPATVARLPDELRRAARRGVASVLGTLGDWKSDPAMRDIAADLTETIGHLADSTRAKGASALRRLQELIAILPTRLTNATATHDVIDVLLADYVNRRTRRARRVPIPPEWTGDGSSPPQPQSVRGEVCSIIGLARTAGLLPADPRGTIPKTRKTMRACGCMKKNNPSPRHYTFLFELIAAYKQGRAGTDIRRWAVWCFAVTAIHFLLRPKYARAINDKELVHVSGDRYRLEFARGDKTNQPPLPPAASAAAAARRDDAGCSSDSSTEDDETEQEDRPASGVSRPVPPKGLPAAHPRYTGSAGPWLHKAQSLWRVVRGECGADEPLFCRVEAARQHSKVPKGARRVKFDDLNCYIWPKTPLSAQTIKKELVAMLAPIIGMSRALKRTLGGFRGGGEMELAELREPVHVRATIGWWVAKRISTEGQMVVYEGASMEDMWDSSRKLGTRYIRVLAPGVYTVTPPGRRARGTTARCLARRNPAPAPSTR